VNILKILHTLIILLISPMQYPVEGGLDAEITP
jgi:hypothetical protein